MKIDWKTPVPTDCLSRIPFLPKTEGVSVLYEGISDGYLYFTLVENESLSERQIAIYLMIDQENEAVWKALEEGARLAVKNAEMSLKGAFTFEIAGVSDLGANSFFGFENFAQWISKQGSVLGVQESKIFPYGGISCFLRKNSLLDWGKVSFQSAIHSVGQEKMADVNFWRRVLKPMKSADEKLEVYICDLSPFKTLLGHMQEEILKTIFQKIKLLCSIRIHQWLFQGEKASL